MGTGLRGGRPGRCPVVVGARRPDSISWLPDSPAQMLNIGPGAAVRGCMKYLLAFAIFAAGSVFGGWVVYEFWGKGVLVSEWELQKQVSRCQKSLDEFYSKTTF